MKILKKLLVLSIITILIIIIYNGNINYKLNYVSLGDGISRGIDKDNKNGYSYSDYVFTYLNNYNLINSYTKKFSKIDNRITDVINDIDDNIEIIENNKKISFKKSIKQADLITLSIGQNELIYKKNTNSLNKNYINEMMDDLKKLIDKIKLYSDKSIYLIGYYNPFYDKEYDNLLNYANEGLKDICSEEKITYIDTYNIFKNNKYLINLSNNYPNKDGYKLIGREIVKNIDKNIKNRVNNKKNSC